MILIYADDTVFSLSFPDSTHRGFEQRHTQACRCRGRKCLFDAFRSTHERNSQMGLPDAARNTPHTVFTQYEPTQEDINRIFIPHCSGRYNQSLRTYHLLRTSNTPWQILLGGARPALAHPANARRQSDWHCSVPQTGVAGWQFWVAGFLGIHRAT